VQRWKRIESIVRRHLAADRRVVVVCSAVSGVTNRIEELVEAAAQPSPLLAEIRGMHRDLAAKMGLDAASLLAEELTSLERCAAQLGSSPSAQQRALLLAHGELMSTRLGAAWLSARGLSCVRVDARDLLQALPVAGDRSERYLSAQCGVQSSPAAQALLDASGARVIVTQGFIARGEDNETVLLGRGGSDTSAAYLAAALDAESVEIWTDVLGMFTTDPRIAPEARLLQRLSYAEAEALGALGAKVLHPRTIEPVRRRAIPLRIGWTDHPELQGTCVTGARAPRGIKAVVGRRDLALVVMTRPPSWQPVGFLADVATCFERRGLSMDLVASSSSEIRATIDLSAFPSARQDLQGLLDDLRHVCRPRLVPRVGCVSVVGAGASVLACPSMSRAFAKAHVHLMVHAANGSHVSFVVDEVEVESLVAAGHRALLQGTGDKAVFGARWDVVTRPLAPSLPCPAEESAA
jgi:diaminopimelate decarboxylase/aspartate kinase